jgi:acyl-CoA thioester hydrolase
VHPLFTPTNFAADVVEVGCAIVKLGTSSVTYRVGIFLQQDPDSKVQRDPRACAIVDFVHVYCDNKTRRPIAMPDKARRALEEILRPDRESPKL